ncbi:hypothetical protein EOD39_13568 [Acipenser ruthenus]|uniref:Uncharacterized protein n=1 Tax=Acipenser ruthenus TaxID=7906 RepID=A0A662YRL6_ACIRT|nr:hypothetical protein EOD39_13568 [Acipenser ruthenus]
MDIRTFSKKQVSADQPLDNNLPSPASADPSVPEDPTEEEELAGGAEGNGIANTTSADKTQQAGSDGTITEIGFLLDLVQDYHPPLQCCGCATPSHHFLSL